MTVEIENRSGREVDDQPRFARLTAYVLDAMHVDPDTEVSLTFVDAKEMEDLHVRWLGLEGPTDVMSFPMDELVPGTPEAPSGPGLLGDVVLCPEVAAGQAAAAGHDVMEEMLLLTVHSLLHLLGYDHAEPAEEAEMFGLQRRLLLGFLGSAPAPGPS
ncbi:MAG: rRNA maturation RNase YbeY [Promicromonosporaceae bacterium]|nr:rRNA maturation RNase YbeY [Promicromonosporaceae bacterium]